MSGRDEPGLDEPGQLQEQEPDAGGQGLPEPLREKAVEEAREGYGWLAEVLGPAFGWVAGVVGSLSGALGAFRAVTWFLDRRKKASEERRAEFDASVERVVAKDNGEFLLGLRVLLEGWSKDRRLRKAMRAMEQRYEARRQRFIEDMAYQSSSLVQLREVMRRDHPDAEDSGTLGLQIGYGSPGDPYSLARFDELAEGAGFHDQDNVPAQLDNSPPDRAHEDEEYTPEMHMLHILRIRWNRLEQRETLGGSRVSQEFRERFFEAERRQAKLIHDFVDWKRTHPEAALHELHLAARALGDPMATPDEDPNISLYALTLGHVGLYDLMGDHTLRPEDLPRDWTVRARARELLRLYRTLLEKVAPELRTAL
jgi:hypothetical protein